MYSVWFLNYLSYNSQSTAIINDTCSVGKPTVERTINMVTRAALGTLATPIDVAVEAKLIKNDIRLNHIE